ncbi:Ig-like domain-containing protein [Alloalcanivorax sp. C16-1]|uniref:Ig-like domain-containing protein n=1 Tax=Alloalcanivorax sp. C16-1 TaxID=3390051 RepID=UPI003970841E
MRAVFLKKSSVLLLSASLLAACGGGGGDSPAGRGGEPATRELTFAYPADGQTEIATPAPVVLRFTDRVDASAVENDVTLTRVDTGDTVAFTATPVGTDGRTLLLQPGQDLAAHTEYRVDLQTLQLDNGVDNLTFTTRAAQRGPRSETITSEQFALNRRYPDGGTQEPVMDFSTFRYQFSQPIDPATATYGETGNVRIVDSEGDLVEARLLVDGPYMTVDPVPDYLTPGEEYRLYLEDGLASTYGLPLDGENIRFTPKDSSPDGEPAILVQKVTVPGDAGTGDGTSRLTGKPINQVPVNSTLLGNDSATQSEGNVAAELASSVVYPFVTPIRVPRNTLLTGSNIDVMIGGAVPAGISSGKVKMHFLSDATGYLTSNPYSTRDDALRQIRLFMDVAIATENPEANGGFTQDLLHIELVGMAEVDTDAGVLNLDAVSMVEPDVLGQEFAHGLLSFQLQSYPDQTNAPPGSVDDAAPTLQSWTFGEDGATGLDKTAMIKPTDPIILNFSEPLERDTVTGKVHLYKNEGGTQTEMDTTVTVDGGAIVIRPAQPLEHPTETGPSLEYQVSIDPGITDLSGEPWVESFDETFSLKTFADRRDSYAKGFTTAMPWRVAEADQAVPKKSPFLLAVYPGFPCALSTDEQNLANGIQGRCEGGIQPESVDPDNLTNLPADQVDQVPESDDLLPVAQMPANRPIVVVFSKDMDPASVELGRTFHVYQIDDQDQIAAEVEGSLTLSGDTLRFMPSNPWQEDTLYRYELASNGDINMPTEAQAANPTGPLCDVATAMCSEEGLPLQTQLLSQVSIHDKGDSPNQPFGFPYRPYYWEEESPSLTGGGPDLVQYFRGDASSDTVLQLLRLADSIDANANLFNDSSPYVRGPAPVYTNKTNGSQQVIGGISWNFIRFPEYTVNETGHINWQPDPSTADLVDRNGVPMDPNGVKPPPNSAKILSRDMGDKSLEEVAERGFSINGAAGPGVQIADPGASSGLLVGCGFDDYEPYPDQTGCDVAGEQEFFPGFEQRRTCYRGIPAECPREKFTYLNGALFAEVTDETVGDDLKVLIHPGQIVTTSFRAFLKGPLKGARGENVAETGYQLMRMRYVDGGPIEAFIGAGPNGPELSASVPLYLDAPYLVTDLTEIKNVVGTAHHNLYSYPVEMALTGPISFMDDGRMLAEQWSTSDVVIEQRVNAPVLSVDLVVPAGGTHIRYVSEPIK